MKQKWLTLDNHIELALSHLTLGIDYRPLVKGTILEHTPFCQSFVGESRLQMHFIPDTMEMPGRWLASLATCQAAFPNYSTMGRSAQRAAEHMVGYIGARTNEQGKYVVPKEEIERVAAMGEYFMECDPGSGGDLNPLAGLSGTVEHGNLALPLDGLVLWYKYTGDPSAKAIIDRMIAGRVHDPDDPNVPRAFVGPYMMSPLADYYVLTGDERAREYMNRFVDHLFFADRSSVGRSFLALFPDGKHCDGSGVGHLSLRYLTLAAMARYAIIEEDRETLDLVDELFGLNTEYGAEFGYLPERHVFVDSGGANSGDIFQPWAVAAEQHIDFTHYTRPRLGYDTCELCVPSDAVDCALVLASAGYEKYWDIAERYLNQIFAAQVTDYTGYPEQRFTRDELPTAKFEGFERDMQGSFLSFTTPLWAFPKNQVPFIRPDGREGIKEGPYYFFNVECCTGAAVRSIGLLWRSIVTEDSGVVDVNFPFDRKAESVTVTSGIPYTGRISVDVHRRSDLRIRIPDWAPHSSVNLSVNGKPRAVEFKSRFSDYVKVGQVEPGNRAELNYPLRRLEKRYHLEYHPDIYEATWLGNSVTGMRGIPMQDSQGDESFDGYGRLYDYGPRSGED